MNRILKKISVLSLVLIMAISSVSFGEFDYSRWFFKDEEIWTKTFEDAFNDLLLEMDSVDDLEIIFDDNEFPSFISGMTSEMFVSNETYAEMFMASHGDVFGFDLGDFDVLFTDFDDLNNVHYKMSHVVDGVPVYGSEMIVHVDDQGKVYAVNGEKNADVEDNTWKGKFKLTPNKAILKTEKAFGIQSDVTYTSEPLVEKYIYPYEGTNYASYLVVLEFLEPSPARIFAFVNAQNGQIIDSYDGLNDADGATTGIGVGLDGQEKTINTYLYQGKYYLYDDSKPMGGQIATYNINNGGETSLPGSYVTDVDNRFDTTDQKAGVDAHYYAGLTYDYFYNTHGRDSYDGNGASIISTVHFQSNYNNAFWSGSQMVYGDGDGTQFSPLSGSLDVVAHELTHAVTEKSANLEYRNQSGALNESYSDVFGSTVEHQFTGRQDWWRLAEDVYTPNIPNDSMRDMKTPENGNQPSHMNAYVTTTQDNGGVHINSGIPNRAYYLAVEAIGFSKAEKIYYRALTQYLTRTSNFNDNRNALLQAATDLYGNMSAEYVAIANTQAAVGIGSPIDNTTSLKAATLSLDQITQADNYTLNIEVPELNSGTSITLFEGSTSIYTANFASNNSNIQNFSKQLSNKPAGTYTYKVVISDGSTTKDSNLITVTVGGQSSSWYEESITYDTAHNYTNNFDKTVSYTKSGAEKVGLHFSYFRLESDYDYVYVMDKNDTIIHTLTGNQDNIWVEVDGDVIKLRMVTDGYVVDWGYRLDKAKYFSGSEITLTGLTQ